MISYHSLTSMATFCSCSQMLKEMKPMIPYPWIIASKVVMLEKRNYSLFTGMFGGGGGFTDMFDGSILINQF